jgi:hypothetical protein
MESKQFVFMKSIRILLSKKMSGAKTPRPATFTEKDIFYVFKKIIQEEFGNIGAAKLKPDYFGKNILHVKAESSAWSSELWLNKNLILRRLKKELGADAVREIKLK